MFNLSSCKIKNQKCTNDPQCVHRAGHHPGAVHHPHQVLATGTLQYMIQLADFSPRNSRILIMKQLIEFQTSKVTTTLGKTVMTGFGVIKPQPRTQREYSYIDLAERNV